MRCYIDAETYYYSNVRNIRFNFGETQLFSRSDNYSTDQQESETVSGLDKFVSSEFTGM